MATVLTQTYDSTTDSNALTITLASLASSATFITGRQSTVVDNLSPNYVDVILSGQVTVGTTPTVSTNINLYVLAPLKVVASTASYPIATTTQLGATDAAATFEANQLAQLRFAGSALVIATSDRAYAFEPISVASLFGGIMPAKWGIYVANGTGVALNATDGNHWFHYQGIKYTNT